MPLQPDIGDAQHVLELTCRNRQRPRAVAHTSLRLGIGGGARSVEGDVAFHFLHDLMDVAVEDRHRAEACEELQSFGRIVCAPAPLRINRPQRNVGEDDEGCGG